MANPEHLAKLKEGVEAWNQWRTDHPETIPDLSGADLSRARLSGNLRKVCLTGSNLREADLRPLFIREDAKEQIFMLADLSEADLNEANLYRAIIRSVIFRGTNLSSSCLFEADLSDADLDSSKFCSSDLRWANLSGARFRMTDLTGARIVNTNFANVDLREVKGLETLEHDGPSNIGIDTIYKSKGKIPHAFLRGAGVPDNFIEYMASLIGTGIEFYSLFLSYSTHDQEFAERLHADLQAKGVRCWFAPHDMRSGKKVHEQIDEAIRVHDKLLLILSPESMSSEWVKTEISKARKREIKEGKRVLFPIRLCSFEMLRDWECFDSDAGMDSAREIREYFIPDFSNWKDHDAYKKAFDRLLRDLQGKPEPASA